MTAILTPVIIYKYCSFNVVMVVARWNLILSLSLTRTLNENVKNKPVSNFIDKNQVYLKYPLTSVSTAKQISIDFIKQHYIKIKLMNIILKYKYVLSCLLHIIKNEQLSIQAHTDFKSYCKIIWYIQF